MDATDNALKMIVKNVLGGMASEFTEEYIQEIIEPVLQNLILDTDHEVKLISPEAAYAGMLGALTAFGTESVDAGVTAARYTGTGKGLIDAGVKADDLAAVGSKFAADTVAYKLADQIDENTDAFTMGRMFHEISANLTEQNVSAIAEALEQEGMPPKIARKNAEIMAYIVEGGKVSDFQMKMIEKNDVLAKVMREVIIDPNSTVYQRSVGYSDVLRKLAGETVEARSTGSGKAKVSTEDATATQKESGSESRSEGGTGDRKASGIVSVKKGNPVVKLDDGSEVSLQDADLSPDDALIIKTVTDIDGISAEDAGDIFKILKAVDSDPASSSLGAMEAYRYGYYGFSEKHLADNANFAKKLTDTQRKAIYDIGQKARQQSLGKSKPKQKSTKGEKTGVYFDQGGGKVVSFSESEKSGLSPQQNAGVRAAMVLRKLGIGGDIYFFESYLNSEGKRVFKNENGEEVSAPNGWYDPKDGSIHIDLNAGNKGQGYVLFTLSHELTHFIEQWSEEKYKVLADFLVKNYEKGHTMDELVRRKQRRLTEIRGKEVSYHEAYSEVVADSMEAMLADGNVMDKLIELKAKDQSLFEKMKQFFDNLLNKIRDAYKGLQPDSEEGKAVLEMQESIEKIQQLFADALVEASENFQSAEKNTTEDGGVDGEYDIKLSPRMEEAFKPYAKVINFVVNQSITGKGNIDGKAQVKDIMPTGPKITAMVAASSGNAIDISERNIALSTSDIWHEFKRHTSVGAETSRGQIAFTKRQFQNAVKCIISPDMVETIFADANNPTQRQSFVYAKKTSRGNYVVVEAVGGKKNPNIYPVMILQFSKAKWNKMMSQGKTLGEILFENDPKKLKALDIQRNKKSRVTAAQFTSYEAIANTLRSPQLTTTVTQLDPAVKKKLSDRDSGNLDRDYMDAVKRGDMKIAQRMVDDAAKAAGFFVRGFHGSSEKFNVFSYGHIGVSTGVGILGEGFYFGDDKALAKMYGPQMYDSYLRMGNTYHATEKDQYKINTAKLAEQGYDSVDMVIGGGSGKIYCVFDNTQIKSAAPVTYDDNGNVIPLSKRFDSSNPDIRYSDRDTEAVSTRDLLARTDVATVKNETAKKKLAGYQKTLEVMTAEEQKLREIRAEIKELSFAKGPRDTKKLKDLKSEAAKISNHLSVYEGQLQRMEKELQSVVKRERAKVVKEAEKRDKAVLAKEWMAAEVKQSETLRDLRETRAALRQQESDTAVMEKEFIRITKEYEKQDAERVKTISDLRKELKNEAKKHRADERMWMAEFGRLMREYDAAGRNQ